MACRAVQQPPYAGALALLEWMIELWPYVNGRALIHGQQLSGMEASDMLDVGYYLLESDLNVATIEQSKAQVVMRESLYQSIYNKTYKYGDVSSSSRRSYDFDSDSGLDGLDEPLEPFNPAAGPETQPSPTTKSYVPPTQFNESSSAPFGEILDSPMN